MTQDGLFLFLGHKIAIIPKTLRCFCFVQHARGRNKKTKNIFYPIFVLVHFWRYVHFRGRRGAQENLYFRRRWLRKFGTRFDIKQGFCEKYSIVFICYLSMKVTQHLGSSWWHAPYIKKKYIFTFNIFKCV